MPDLKDHVALVTGASQGIARACSIALAQTGAKVALAARNEEKLAHVVSEIKAAGGEAAAFKMDVANEDEIKPTAKPVIDQFGKIDIRVTQAGVTRAPL